MEISWYCPETRRKGCQGSGPEYEFCAGYSSLVWKARQWESRHSFCLLLLLPPSHDCCFQTGKAYQPQRYLGTYLGGRCLLNVPKSLVL